ncbi:hypothetical protein AGABI1DRAFT_102835 [Agaricus bisporus var. burnettii JB137-S8]|uniref:gluconokinase n=1 Tax=Agaricus bisporus var. burnettii (strain JB137-S8 / ATCC MYA-4627 / FGSC 10392) TaxID=597362 RepID=K5WXL1_AGABU|nr:uncharacterized protein AGABI1DRAFT_102835 [Agaricus bisporus var. burnettii JB137-S8]EKM75553.1 hypothetical protein AGABI1DRAFT_102835 [Agaricus bisporus var. burnettii JB137-S8]
MSGGDRNLNLDLGLGRDGEGREEEGGGGVCVVVMGVSGTGKTTLGIALSEGLGVPYIEGDELHPKENVAKMSSGVPLTDEDRRPWLEVIRERAERTCLDLKRKSLREGNGCSFQDAEGGGHGYRRCGVVITCSALKKSYRDILRGEPPCQDNQHPEKEQNPPSLTTTIPPPRTYFIWINGSKEVLQDRIGKRQNHFFKASMLDSQLTVLESPEDEEGVVVVPLEADTQEQVRIAIEGLQNLNTMML